MILSAIIGLIQNILYYVILYCIGKLLHHSEQLRNFLGLSTEKDQEYHHHDVTFWVEKIGSFVMYLAIVGVIYSVVTTIAILSRI